MTHQETLAIVWALKHFSNIILGYPITVFTDHAPVTELFKGRNLTGRLARWYLTIQEFGPTFKYLPGRANAVTDSLSRYVPVGFVAEMLSQIENCTLQVLAAAQRQHNVWSKSYSLSNQVMKQVSRHYLCLFHNFSCLRAGSCVSTGPAKRSLSRSLWFQSAIYRRC